jgi:Sec-independent protein translocase protein TatA
VTPLSFLDIGFPELCVVAFLGLALYGGRLPEVMRSWGAAYRKLRNSFENLTRETADVQRQMPRLYTPQPPKDPAALPRLAPAAAPDPSPPAGTAPAAPLPPPPAASVESAEDDAPPV